MTPPDSPVECYAGASYPTEPRAVWWEGQRQAVSRILARWRTPAGPGFRIETEAGARFRLEYDAANDRWQVNKLDTDQ